MQPMRMSFPIFTMIILTILCGDVLPGQVIANRKKTFPQITIYVRDRFRRRTWTEQELRELETERNIETTVQSQQQYTQSPAYMDDDEGHALQNYMSKRSATLPPQPIDVNYGQLAQTQRTASRKFTDEAFSQHEQIVNNQKNLANFDQNTEIRSHWHQDQPQYHGFQSSSDQTYSKQQQEHYLTNSEIIFESQGHNSRPTFSYKSQHDGTALGIQNISTNNQELKIETPRPHPSLPQLQNSEHGGDKQKLEIRFMGRVLGDSSVIPQQRARRKHLLQQQQRKTANAKRRVLKERLRQQQLELHKLQSFAEFFPIITIPVFQKQSWQQQQHSLNTKHEKRRNMKQRQKGQHLQQDLVKRSNAAKEKEEVIAYSIISATPLLKKKSLRQQQFNVDRENLSNMKQGEEYQQYLQEFVERPSPEEVDEFPDYSTIITTPVLQERWQQHQLEVEQENVRVLKVQQEYQHKLENHSNEKDIDDEELFQPYSTIMAAPVTERLPPRRHKLKQSNTKTALLELRKEHPPQDFGNFQPQVPPASSQHLQNTEMSKYIQDHEQQVEEVDLKEQNYPNSIQAIIQENKNSHNFQRQTELTSQQLLSPTFETTGQVSMIQQHQPNFPMPSLGPTYQSYQAQLPSIQITQQIPSPMPFVQESHYMPSYPNLPQPINYFPQPVTYFPVNSNHPQTQPLQLSQNSKTNLVVWRDYPKQQYRQPRPFPVVHNHPLINQHQLMDWRPLGGGTYQSSLSLTAAGLKTVFSSLWEVLEMLIGSISLFLYVVYAAFIMPFKNDVLWGR